MDESLEPGPAGPAPELTGDTAVDAVLARLSGVAETPVADHAELYSGLHDGLLAALNEEPVPSPASMPDPAAASGPVPVPHPGRA